MYHNKKITLYIPCRNESKSLAALKTKIPDFIDEVIIVSNKSTDDTYEKALSLGFKAYKDDRTKDGIGYGFAHMTGMEKATGDILISADGDGQHPIEEVGKILDFMFERDLDFISCSRYPLSTEENTSFKQLFGVSILNWEIRLLYGLKLNDALTGMWVYKKEIIEKLNVTEGDWNMTTQIKINAATNKNIKFAEYNIAQLKRSIGTSHHQYFNAGFKYVMWIFKNRFGMTKKFMQDDVEAVNFDYNLT